MSATLAGTAMAMAAMPAQALVIGMDQVGLADRGGRLELPEVLGPAFPPELSHPCADRARADQRYLSAAVHHHADLLGQVIDSSGIERPIRARQHARAHLHDPCVRRQHNLVSYPVAHDRRGRLLLGR